MVVAEHQQSVLPQDTPAFFEHPPELGGELFRADVLHLFDVTSRMADFGKRRGTQLLPGEKEIGQF